MKIFVYHIIVLWLLTSCDSNSKEMQKILFLHHSTGAGIWMGNTNKYIYKLTKNGDVKSFFQDYNKKNKSNYHISDLIFPKKEPYGWKNYPYDYYNIWVKNAGNNPYNEEPTLEILTAEYDVIIFKHCYPVSRIQEDTGHPDINSEEKRLENYKLQYNALKEKMHQFPQTRFIVWTPAAMVKSGITEVEAKRAFEFYRWVKDEWDEKGDNIFLWDFYNYETEGKLYLLEKYAHSKDNSHPGKEFSGRIAPLFGNFIIDVIKNVN